MKITAGDIFLLSLFFTFLFWQQGSWRRIDCSLGITYACEKINQEYIKKAAEDAEREEYYANKKAAKEAEDAASNKVP